jgi:tetratricopeptide (TPR) repeat protein
VNIYKKSFIFCQFGRYYPIALKILTSYNPIKYKEVKLMRPKSAIFAFPIGLLATIILIGSSPAGTAQTISADLITKSSNEIGSQKNEADYWFDKGALCATYGNDSAAIKYFQKTISLAPQRSAAYFEQGVSYGQLGNFSKAIALINKAIEMDPYNGLYYYGRGRVHLLAGEREKAIEDFKVAARLDDEDAQNYMDSIAKTQ